MTKARDLANLASNATVTATQSYVTTAISNNNTSYVDTSIAAADSTPTALMTMGA